MKNKRHFEVVFASLILLLMNVMCIYEIYQYRTNIFLATAREQKAYLNLLRVHVNDTEQLDETIIGIFNEEFDTNSRYFGFLFMDDELIYFRDDSSLKQAQDILSDSFDVSTMDQGGYDMITLANGSRYLISMETLVQREHTYVVGILQEEMYILKRTQFLSYARHTVLFQVITSLAVFIFLIQLHRIAQRQAVEIEEWKDTQQQNRTLIERLLQDVRIAQKTHIENTTFGFLRKQQFARVLTSLDEEKQCKCQLIRIYVIPDDPLIRIHLAAILQRMDILKCVSCEWHPKEFCVLVLNVETSQIENILRYIITTYRRDYGGELEDLKLVTQALRRK